jgi:hypothetical protein
MAFAHVYILEVFNLVAEVLENFEGFLGVAGGCSFKKPLWLCFGLSGNRFLNYPRIFCILNKMHFLVLFSLQLFLALFIVENKLLKLLSLILLFGINLL